MRINGQIRVSEVRVVLEDGSSLGIMPTYDALKIAREKGLDLIEINPKSIPPVCKIESFGKMKYDEKKKQQAAKKNQPTQELKQISISANIADNDLAHKITRARQFLSDGNKVKITLKFRGREITHIDVGKYKIDYIISQLSNETSSVSQIFLEGRIMNVTLLPIRK